MSASRGVPVQKLVNGRAVRCPVCGGDHFYKSSAMLVQMELFTGIWSSPNASTYTCFGCAHILWFHDLEPTPEDEAEKARSEREQQEAARKAMEELRKKGYPMI